MASGKKIWTAYFAAGLHSPVRVYGVDESEARRNALAQFRFVQGALDKRPMCKVVDRVEPVCDGRGMYSSRAVSEFDEKSLFDRRI